MSPVVTVTDLTKRYRDVTALDGISFSLTENRIHGLLGRNGAGKTTLMQILTAQNFATSGDVAVFGQHPYENERVLSRISFIKESQTYPSNLRVSHVLRAGGLVHPGWDEEFAQRLIDVFQLPRQRNVRKLSRGMLSSLGIVVGLASRAPLTFFDEPYLGLDAVARQLFYDHLLADYTEHPRTIVLSTHLIDEVSDLIEHVLLMDRGRLLLDVEAEALRGQVVTVSGPVAAVDEFARTGAELHRVLLGGTARATVRGDFGPAAPDRARSLGLDLEASSLQDIVVRLTTSKTGHAPGAGGAGATNEEAAR
ncbi:ABC-2 type transport system ATP-binding protein [Micromonospora phaseoli]|uniref:ABC-2 type transport system ATP-binding protein n=1 Tax=Micromonospora phaseoli TaxID=1144548 RepID=A0A1H7CDX1_9ACTN|nr:ABC transporter ATP-binding protein [Micromonospora phaseoli]PZV97882.1 ABC-2 type transport system ATP-binding protein [Micromonospora phaseoli]GIJ78549.1 ABC transporter ATP-binding protein [Micromonospora phaseoli]SEJ87858.1 ABC-2 type transport system ATP-binding protein [Micromonospora phaseoli]